MTIRSDITSRASLELLYNVSRELTAALDLRRVLQRVLMLSMQNIGADRGTIIVLDERGEPIDSAIIIGEQLIENTTQQLKWTLENGLAGWVVRNKQAVLIKNTSQDERWIPRYAPHGSGTVQNSALSVALIVRDQLVGVMTLIHPTVGFFNQDHFELIQAIADQAGIAILNARLYDESRRKANVMTALAESATVITSSLDLNEVLQRILEQISHALRAEVVSLALIDPKGDKLSFVASSASTGSSLRGYELQLGEGIAGWVAREGQGVIIADVTKDDRFSQDLNRFSGSKINAIACAPIRSGSKLIGVVEAINPQGGIFDPDALQVLTGIGSLAGTAIRHAQVFDLLQSAHQRYHELFQDSIDSILITDTKGSILEANRQSEITTGIIKGELINRSIAELHSLNWNEVGAAFEHLSSGQTISYQSSLSTHDGIQLPIQVYVRQVQIEGAPHFQWIFRDISERKNLDRLREDLLSMIYHDLRSPLANIVSSLDVFDAMLPQDTDPSYRSLLNIALRSTERIKRLTNSLLDINRLESGQPVGNRFATSPLLLARDAFDEVMPVAINKNQTIEIALPDDIPPVYVEADMIRRVIINLLENAVKYTPQGGSITLGGEPIGSQVRFWVQDTGPGIPAVERDRIFDKYTRLDPKDGPKGIGLGLAYCRLAIEAHEGRIWVESEPGSGARFYFTLPIAKDYNPP